MGKLPKRPWRLFWYPTARTAIRLTNLTHMNLPTLTHRLRRALAPRGGLAALALLLGLAPGAAAQTGSISGIVLDDLQQPLVQANIFIPELDRGAASDLNGEYTLSDVPAGTYEVRVSFAGFEPQTVAVTVLPGETVTQNFELAPQEFETVIVEGYRVRRQAVESAAASRVEAREIETLTVRSANAALQGRAAGVRVTAASGQPGAGIVVNVRGSGSITAGTDPLYIVDGVQISNDDEGNLASTNPLASINPQEIESIEVLKDASATSIYGSQAANGVVLITTKRGQAGRTNIEFSTQVGSVQPISDYRVLTATEYLQNRYDARLNRLRLREGRDPNDPATRAAAAANTVSRYGGRAVDNDDDGVAETFVPENRVPADVNGDGTIGEGEFAIVDTNWQDAVFRDAVTQQYSLAARGGNDRTRFYVRGNYTNDEGQVIASQFEQYGFRVNLDHNISDNVQFESSLNAANSNYRGTIGGGAFINSPFWAAQFIPPTNAIYTVPNNEESGFNLRPNPTFSYNPVAQESFDTRTSDVFRLIGSGAMNVQLPYGLLTRSFGGFNFGDIQEEDYRDPRIPQNAPVGGRLSVLASRTLEFNLSQSLQFARQFAQSHALDLLGVVEYRRGFEDDFNTRGAGFPNSLFRTLASAATPEITGGGKTEFRFTSLIGNAEYTYDNTYQLAATLRYDGSSRFGVENPFGLFGSVGGFIRLSNFGPLRGSSLVNDLKLRASYGTTGNANIGNFASRQLIGSGGEYAGLPGITPTSLGNTFLTWEELAEANVGLDATVFGGRLSFSTDVYNRDSNELLLDRPLTTDSGFGSVTSNIGTVRQQGLEFSLQTQNVDAGLFSWTTNFNIAFQRAEVRSLVGEDSTFVLLEDAFGNDPVGGEVYRIGEAPAQYRLVEYAGVNPANGRPMYYDPRDGSLTYDGASIPLEDQELFGNELPDYFGGVGNTFAFGPVALDVFFQYDFGRTTFNNNAFFSDSGFDFNKSERVLDAWQQPGDVVAQPAPIDGDFYNDATSARLFGTTRYLEDASYIRLKQLTLSFQVPARYLGTVARNARIYLQGENLVTFTEYSDIDPEVVGTALGEYPQNRRIIGGISVGL